VLRRIDSSLFRLLDRREPRAVYTVALQRARFTYLLLDKLISAIEVGMSAFGP